MLIISIWAEIGFSPVVLVLAASQNYCPKKLNLEVAMANKKRAFREVTVPTGFTSLWFVLESHTVELQNRGLLFSGEFKDHRRTPISSDEINSSYSNLLKIQFQYAEEIEPYSPFFVSKPFEFSRLAHYASINALEWGKGFSNDESFEQALSDCWMILENTENRTSWIQRMEYR